MVCKILLQFLCFDLNYINAVYFFSDQFVVIIAGVVHQSAKSFNVLTKSGSFGGKVHYLVFKVLLEGVQIFNLRLSFFSFFT